MRHDGGAGVVAALPPDDVEPRSVLAIVVLALARIADAAYLPTHRGGRNSIPETI